MSPNSERIPEGRNGHFAQCLPRRNGRWCYCKVVAGPGFEPGTFRL